jgi:hypothetical protein
MTAVQSALETVKESAREEGYQHGWENALRSVHAVLVKEAIKLILKGEKEAGRKRFDELDPAIKFLEEHYEELRNLPK